MRADVAHHQRGAPAVRVFLPGAPTWPCLGPAALHVLDLDHADLAQLTLRHHGARLAHHGITGVVVCQAEHAPRRLHLLVQLLGLGQGVGHRLVADDVETQAQGLHREREMAVIGRHDGHHLCAIGGCRLRSEEPHATGMTAFGCQADVPAGGERCFGVGRQRGCDQFIPVVEPGRLPVHGTDERPRAAADDGEPQAASQQGDDRIQRHGGSTARISRPSWGACPGFSCCGWRCRAPG